MAITADQLIQEIEGMTVLELANIVKALEERFGVSAAAVAVSGAPAAAAAVVEEQTEFTVVLTSPGDKKLEVIKALRELIPGLGLKEAKDMADGAPQNVKEGVTKDEAKKIKERLEAAGAKVDLK